MANNLTQVFNLGRPSGWLGTQTHPHGGGSVHWFHYSSRATNQPWFSLLMPPSQTFYHSTQAFPPLPVTGAQADLSTFSNQWLGTLSFANPDAPVVRPRPVFSTAMLETSTFDELLRTVGGPIPKGQGLLIQTDRRFGTADTLAYPLLPTKLQTLPGLRRVGQLHLLPRPDLDPKTQQRYGAEPVYSSLGLQASEWEQCLGGPSTALRALVYEAIRTYSRQPGPDIAVFNQQMALVQAGQLNPYWIYRQPTRPNDTRPQVLALVYLPNWST